MKYIVTLITLCLITASISTNKFYANSEIDVNDKILWLKNRNLIWEDFQGNPPNNKDAALAATQCEIKIIKIELVDNLPNIIIGTYFIKSRSWTVTTNHEALEHEQLHFDIYELFSRKIRKGFMELNNQKIADIKFYEDLYKNLINCAIEENNNYDFEVYFNEKKQQEWISRITNELEKLKEYEYKP
ncbi:hypothetical protein GWK08_06630 [Leptobacterium flavescens]|uniref:DUF922 domain-containing protein n=1 Tax=Leptobacterium flavescens TaxID=472055 RepID=A0A6P0UJF1_9FLAO|nr:hypothetical protein [Leptobacterium flavescens]NER13107.1 hypothetical protein [Leptobacterium flavescens]